MDLQMLVDMGFAREKAQKALNVTGNGGVEAAMEWLLAHSDEFEVAPECVSADSTNTNEPNANADAGACSSANDSTYDPTKEAKSFKCEDCNRLFKDHMEMEFHAAKSGHSNFSESTEEKQPLTQEQKKEQLARLEEKLRLKRLEREETEKREALEREKFRIKSGKDMSEAQRKIEEQEMKKLVDQRKREKQEDRLARERVRAQIEADKAARREQMAQLTGKVTTNAPTSPNTVTIAEPSSTSSSTVNTSKSYANTRIQIRLLNGSTLVETFDVKEQLSAVRLFVQIKQGIDTPFGLMTNFPRKVYSDEDYEKPLEALGLVPSAVLIVTKSK